MDQKRIALLDTDFTVKTIMSQNDLGHCLLDLLMQRSDYSFACHEKTIDEVKDHNYCGAYDWVQNKVKTGIVCVYSDEEIIEILSTIYGDGSVVVYTNLLKNSCDAFGRTIYQDNYSEIDNLPPAVERDVFLKKLHDCDVAYGKGKGLGEIKLLILLQALEIIHPGDVSVFCSDDSGARTGVYSTASIHCISVITLFYHLKNWGVEKSEAEPYYISYKNTLSSTQTTFKVYNKNRSVRIDIPCDTIFDYIYEDKYIAYGTGVLIER